MTVRNITITMLSADEVNFILENARFPGNKYTAVFKLIGRILFFIIFLALPIFSFYAFFTNPGARQAWPMIPFMVIIFCFGVGVLVTLKDEMQADSYFVVFETGKPAVDNLALMKAILQNDFKVVQMEADDQLHVILTGTKMSFLTWGDIITTVCDSHRILVNSKASYEQLFSYGRQKRNIRKISLALGQVNS